MIDTVVIEDRAIRLFSEEDNNYALSFTVNSKLDSKSLDDCIKIKEELSDYMLRITKILDTFIRVKYDKYIYKDYLEGQTIHSRYRALRDSFYALSPESARLCDMMQNTNWVFMSYKAVCNRIFVLERKEDYEKYIIEDAKFLLSHIKDCWLVDSFLDISYDKHRFKSLLNFEINDVIPISLKAFKKMIKKIESYPSIDLIPLDYLKSFMHYITLYFMKDSVCCKVIVSLFYSYYGLSE